jgi:phosphoglycerol transferase MdoB-like AlkP superfamily enzyme
VAPRHVALVAAIALLNASLSFQNIWPTPAIRWEGELSIEAAIALLLLLAVHGAARLEPSRDGRTPSSAWIRALAIVWVVLTIGHYADVTAPALYGRDINLYWDVRYMPDVAAMVARAAPLWLIVIVVSAVVATLALLYLIFRWALGRVVDAMASPRARAGIAVYASAVLLLFGAHQVGGVLPASAFSTPVTETYARQARLVAGAMRASTTLPPSPPMDADLSRVRGADVFLIFIESYGAIAFERPEIASRLDAPRAGLDAAIRTTGRRVVSAFVDSPTFGGSSWLAHVSLMSGVEVRDPETNSRLLTERRDSMVTNFKRRGFRAVALMPGLRQRWPEGAFYGFDDIYGAERLDYRGPEFGWFALPDQFSLARFDTLEVDRAARPNLFVFYPTISTHFPFSPTPPYQPDWSRMFDRRPYDGPSIVRAYAQQPDWKNFGPGYVDAVSYTYATLAGYLRKQANRDGVFILLGDHQPAAAVTGERASWSVPVHVVTSRPGILDALVARGFQKGLRPARPALGRMDVLLPILLDVFSER